MITQVMIGPDWFAAKDLIIHGFIVLTLILIAAFSFRFYFLKKKENKNYLYFALSFILLAISFLWKMATDITIVYDMISTKKVGILTITFKTLYTEKLLFVAGHFVHYLLFLLGLYILYVVLNRKSTMNHLLLLYFIVITTVFSNFSYFIFHLTALALLTGIIYRYYWIYRANKRLPTKIIVVSFCIIAFSQLVYMFVKLWPTVIYIAAQALQAIGFLLLLIAFVLALKYGKKKSNKHRK